MRFMVMHKLTGQMEKGLPPEPALLAALNELVQDGLKEKIFLSAEGLRPSSERVHVSYKGGKRVITDGPFAEAKELVAGFALMRVRTREEALAWADRFAAVTGDVELFMGPVVEPWDLGLIPRPANPPLRILSMHQMDERAENEVPPSPQFMEKMGALVDEMTKAGVLQAGDGLASTTRGARIHYKGGTPTVVDGPFAESKELIAGFAIIDVPTRKEAVQWALRFGEIVKVEQIEVRQMAEW